MASVVEAVERDLEVIGLRDAGVADSALAATALVLAGELDSGTSATSKSMCAKVLREIMDRLAELAPAPEEADQLDELSAARAARRASVS